VDEDEEEFPPEEETFVDQEVYTTLKTKLDLETEFDKSPGPQAHWVESNLPTPHYVWHVKPSGTVSRYRSDLNGADATSRTGLDKWLTDIMPVIKKRGVDFFFHVDDSLINFLTTSHRWSNSAP